jgi:four helix bundle protein
VTVTVTGRHREPFAECFARNFLSRASDVEGMKEEPFLEHERLDVYRAALAFDALANLAAPKRGQRELRQQLDRATTGIVLCIAEGAGRRSGPDKRRFYEMARGSALECAAVFDILRGRGLVSAEAYGEGRLMLVRIVQMLTRMSGLPRDASGPQSR